MVKYIGEITEQVPIVEQEELGKRINSIFGKNQDVQGISVLSNEKPVGLVMRSHFYKNLGTQYGYVIYTRRPIKLIMDTQPLIVDYYKSITEVSNKAMNREQSRIYDYIMIIRNSKYYGIVSIKKLLTTFSEIQINAAKYSNPLSGLPGNKLIQEKLNYILNQNKYSILYFDLDNFKPFNDIYGFNRGDDILKLTANIINKYVILNGKKDYFLGHVGGDDFVALLTDNNYTTICENIIAEFDKKSKELFDEKHRLQGYYYTQNRHGLKEKYPLVTISIAVITNEYCKFNNINELSELAAKIKKACKKHNYSCYLTNTNYHKEKEAN